MRITVSQICVYSGIDWNRQTHQCISLDFSSIDGFPSDTLQEKYVVTNSTELSYMYGFIFGTLIYYVQYLLCQHFPLMS